MFEYSRILFKEKRTFTIVDDCIKYFLKAIEKGSIQVMYKYGEISRKGLKIEQNEEKGIKY